MGNDPANGIDPTGMVVGGAVNMNSGRDGTYFNTNIEGSVDFYDWGSDVANPGGGGGSGGVQIINLPSQTLAYYYQDGVSGGGEEDPTDYYSNKGEKLGTINDGTNNVVIVDEGKEGFVSGLIKNLSSFVKVGLSAKKVQEFIANNGITYDIKSFSEFFKKYGTSVKATTFAGQKISEMQEIKLDDRPARTFYAEVGTATIVRNRTVGLASGVYTIGDAREFWPQIIPKMPGRVGDIHTHSFSERSILSYYIHQGIYINRGGPITPGLSPADFEGMSQFSKYRSVMADRNFIYLYNSFPKQTIKVPH